jgi:uncharacterized membrane protein
MRRNVNDWERVASIAAGAALLWFAVKRAKGKRLATTAAIGLLSRGVTGYCGVSALLGRGSDRSNTKVALGGPRGVHVYESVVIDRPHHELFAFWRDFSNLPRFMEHLDDVQVLTPTRSVWTAKAPAGMRVKWEAEVINEIEGELIGWQSTENADVATAGSVRFVPTADGRTEIIVHLQYEPPAGRLGSLVASLFGEEPSQQVRADLRRLKELLEHNDVPRSQPIAPTQDPQYI